MKKNVIKIVKRNKMDAAKKAQPAAPPEPEGETQLTMVKAVKNWISERRENSQAEKAFSDGKILEWK